MLFLAMTHLSVSSLVVIISVVDDVAVATLISVSVADILALDCDLDLVQPTYGYNCVFIMRQLLGSPSLIHCVFITSAVIPLFFLLVFHAFLRGFVRGKLLDLPS